MSASRQSVVHLHHKKASKLPVQKLFFVLYLFLLIAAILLAVWTGSSLKSDLWGEATKETVQKDHEECRRLANPRRLELLHIPKTGGSWLEQIAARHNVSWGSCHWIDNIWSLPCPRHPQRPKDFLDKWEKGVRVITPFWHVPVQYLDQKDVFNPYQNADLVVVVRHPYERLLSHWKYMVEVDGNHPRYNDNPMNPVLMERMTFVKHAKPGTPLYFVSYGHLVPQSDFVLGGRHYCSQENRNCTVHVLRQERLEEEFACLMKKYNLDWKLPSHHVNKVHSGRTLTVANFTQETKRLASQLYATDFEMFGYQP